MVADAAGRARQRKRVTPFALEQPSSKGRSPAHQAAATPEPGCRDAIGTRDPPVPEENIMAKTKNRDNLIAWLRDAHAMERATIDNIDRLLERMKSYPEFVARYRTHLEESREQLTRVDRALETLGADNSAMKDLATRLTGWGEAFVTAAADDEAVKHCLAAYGYENFEAASYISLIAAAEACGEPEIAAELQLSLREEEEMARWLETFIPTVTLSFLVDEGEARPGLAEGQPAGRGIH
jgi:ferritin-like metal-binding protein YciE